MSEHDCGDPNCAGLAMPPGDHQRGLYGKYRVERIDGKRKGPYFVLAYTTDPHARAALAAYADSCEDEYPLLAADLRRELGND